MNNARKGKIARAPFEVRTRVNELLRDGGTALDVINYLKSQQISGVKAMNVTNWRQGGYQDWLAERSRFDHMEADRDFALELVRAGEGNKLGEAAQVLAASQLFNTLREFDIGSLKELLADKPENYAPIVNALSKISQSQLAAQKYRDLVAEQKRKIEAALSEGKKSRGGFSTETIEKIERELKLL
jgi:hypothetical protein